MDSLSSLQTKIHDLEDLGRIDEAITYNQQLLDLLSDTDNDFAEDYVWALVDMSYFYSSTGDLFSATDYAIQGIQKAQQYITRNISTWVNRSDTLTISNALMLCESSIRQCYEAIEDCYSGASPQMQDTLKMFFSMDSIIAALQQMCYRTDQIKASTTSLNKRMMIQQLNRMYHHILWETILFAHYLHPTDTLNFANIQNLYYSTDDNDYRLRAATRLSVSWAIKENADSLLYWLDIVQKLDSSGAYAYVVQENKSWLAAQQADWNTALPMLKYSMENKRDSICKEFIFSSAQTRLNSWVNNYAWYFQQNLELCALTNHPDSVNAFLYDNLLIKKGILLAVQVEMARLLREHNLSDIADSLYIIRQIRHTIQQLTLNGDTCNHAHEANKIRQMEHYVLDAVSQVGDITKPLRTTTKDITESLSQKAIAVEFFRVLDGQDKAWIMALVLRNNWDEPKLITIGREEQFMPLVQDHYLYETGYDLTQIVWGKIIEEGNIEDGDTICFSPDGIFNTIGIEYLPLAINETMYDRYAMHRLSSTRQLCDRQADNSIGHALLYGGIRYTTDTTTDTPIPYLPYSLDEVEQINHCLTDGELLTGIDGTESSFRELSGNSPNILHVATHGFCLSESSASSMQRQNVLFVRLTNRQKINVEDVALTRTGLLFAGAGQAWGGQSHGNTNDGILTASEISLLDLRNTQLVVLSACETGLGYATIDGVVGLQRGFKQAGAQTIIMSLWEVSDEATLMLMTQFYCNLSKQNMSRQSAFKHAIQAVRQHYAEPDYWAGFVMLD